MVAGIATGEMQTQHAFDTSIKVGSVEPLWHFRVRTKPQGGGLFQIRTGPILAYDWTERFTLIGGYYYTRQQQDDGDRLWTTINRGFGGAETELWNRKVEVDWRTLLERFMVVGEPDYFRFRNRLRLSPAGGAAPYISVEVLVDAKGLASTRYSAGWRRPLGDELVVDFGYFFEERGAGRAANNRHMFSTSFHWRNKTRRIDPDI